MKPTNSLMRVSNSIMPQSIKFQPFDILTEPKVEIQNKNISCKNSPKEKT